MLSFVLATRMLVQPITHLVVATGGASVSVNGGLIASVIQFGFLGAVFIDVVGTHKFLVPAWTVAKAEAGHAKELALKDVLVDQLKADMVELKEANRALAALTQDKMIPALVHATEVSRAYVTELARRNNERGGRDGS